MKLLKLTIMLALIAMTGQAQKNWNNGRLKVSDNQRFLQFENGKPFFWQGETAWLMPERLNREEVECYKDRPNIIWIMGGDIQGDIRPEVWETLATTIKQIDKNHLMTYHPRGRYTSAHWWSKASWIDFHTYGNNAIMQFYREGYHPFANKRPEVERLPHRVGKGVEDGILIAIDAAKDYLLKEQTNITSDTSFIKQEVDRNE